MFAASFSSLGEEFICTTYLLSTRFYSNKYCDGRKAMKSRGINLSRKVRVGKIFSLLFVVIKYFCGVKIEFEGKNYCESCLCRKPVKITYEICCHNGEMGKVIGSYSGKSLFGFCLCNWNFLSITHVTEKLVQQ